MARTHTSLTAKQRPASPPAPTPATSARTAAAALERAAQVLVLGDRAGGVEAQADDVEAQVAVAGDVVAAVA